MVIGLRQVNNKLTHKLKNVKEAIVIQNNKETNNGEGMLLGELAYHIIIKPNNILVQVIKHTSSILKLN